MLFKVKKKTNFIKLQGQTKVWHELLYTKPLQKYLTRKKEKAAMGSIVSIIKLCTSALKRTHQSYFEK